MATEQTQSCYTSQYLIVQPCPDTRPITAIVIRTSDRVSRFVCRQVEVFDRVNSMLGDDVVITLISSLEVAVGQRTKTSQIEPCIVPSQALRTTVLLIQLRGPAITTQVRYSLQ